MENILLYGIIILTFVVIILIILFFKLSKRLKKISAGKNASSLENIIIENNELIQKIEQRQTEHTEKIKHIELELTKTIKNISVVRFDALGDLGGKQSFAIGLTDSNKTGVVISSMYTRGSMNVFAKEITKGISKHNLTNEEKQVINSH